MKRLAIPADLRKAGEARLLSEHAYEGAWVRFWRQIKPLEDDRFWPLADCLAVMVGDLWRDHDCDDPVARAVDEFFRLTVTRESEVAVNWGAEPSPLRRHPAYTYMDAVRFVAAYEAKAAAAWEVISEHGDYGKSDDGVNDLADVLPLAGRDVHSRVLRKQLLNTEALYRVLRRKGVWWTELILDGEEYARMRLSDEAEKRLLFFILEEMPPAAAPETGRAAGLT